MKVSREWWHCPDCWYRIARDFPGGATDPIAEHARSHTPAGREDALEFFARLDATLLVEHPHLAGELKSRAQARTAALTAHLEAAMIARASLAAAETVHRPVDHEKGPQEVPGGLWDDAYSDAVLVVAPDPSEPLVEPLHVLGVEQGALFELVPHLPEPPGEPGIVYLYPHPEERGKLVV